MFFLQKGHYLSNGMHEYLVWGKQAGKGVEDSWLPIDIIDSMQMYRVIEIWSRFVILLLVVSIVYYLSVVLLFVKIFHLYFIFACLTRSQNGNFIFFSKLPVK
jgi:hypothetical protein